MSRENVELVRQIIDANRSDRLQAAIEAAVALSHPTIEFTSIMAAVSPQTYRGHDGIRRYFNEMADSWEEWRNETEEVFDAGPDMVVVVFRSSVIGKASGVAVETQRAMVCVLSEGKLLRGQVYPSRAEALKAVGLSG
jgi:ketosteroid isomerase-like protein